MSGNGRERLEPVSCVSGTGPSGSGRTRERTKRESAKVGKSKVFTAVGVREATARTSESGRCLLAEAHVLEVGSREQS